MAVEDENTLDQTLNSQQKDLSDHERQLLLEYKTKEALDESAEKSAASKKGGKQVQTSSAGSQTDSYEKVKPRHGDMGFHKFLSVIQKNPGHVLRYFNICTIESVLLKSPNLRFPFFRERKRNPPFRLF